MAARQEARWTKEGRGGGTAVAALEWGRAAVAGRRRMAVAACGQWQPALPLLRELWVMKLALTVLLSHIPTIACEKSGQWQPAWSLLREKWVAKLVPTVLRSYIPTSACEKCGQWQPAQSLLREMWVAKLVPTVLRYSAGSVRSTAAGGHSRTWSGTRR